MLELAVRLSLNPHVAMMVHMAAPTDPGPQDKDVKAGGVAALVFVLLILAVAYIGYSFSKQIKKVTAAKEAGVFDEPADDPAEPATGVTK